MKRVYIASPLSAPTDAEVVANIQLAQRLCLNAMLLENVAAWAPHVAYSSILNDRNPDERMLGMEAGQAWLSAADEIWIYSKNGISWGMAKEIELAASKGITVVWDPKCFAGVGE